MGEIKHHFSNETKMVEIILKIIGPSPPCRLNIPSSIKVHELRKMIAESRHMPIENLRLVLRGNILQDGENGDDVAIQFNNGDSLIVAVKPKAPPKHFRDKFDDDDDDDELRFQLPPSTSKWKRKLFYILHDRLKLPDVILMVIFSISLKVGAIVVTWFILASIARRYDVAPLFLLATGFGLIFYNLGKRQQGELSLTTLKTTKRRLPREDERFCIQVPLIPASMLYKFNDRLLVMEVDLENQIVIKNYLLHMDNSAQNTR